MPCFGETFERVEKKYLLAPRQRALLMTEIDRHMELGEYGMSTITSLYLDTPDRSLICRSLERPLYKEKLRVRHYGALTDLADDTAVFLEMKKKFKGVVYKRRLSMSWAATRDFLSGIPYEEACARFPLADPALAEKSLSPRSIQIAREISAMHSRYPSLGYSMLISCERLAYQPRQNLERPFDDGLRITLDDSIAYREVTRDGVVARPQALLPKGECLMEVKAMGAFPLWLVQALSRWGIRPTSFSKYGEAFKATLTQACAATQARAS